MGQKINPHSYRLGVIENWKSRWMPKKSFKEFLMEDEVIRNTIMKKIGSAGVSRIHIERTANSCRVHIKAAKPGLIIGRGGSGIELLGKAIESALVKLRTKEKLPARKTVLNLNVEELKRTEVAAGNIAQNIAWDLENRLPFRRTIKKAIENNMQNREVKGIKVRVSGRLDGSEIARREWLAKGKLPLQTLRADIDYGEATAHTTYGTIGVKVWVYKGEVFSSGGGSALGGDKDSK